ncbi:MAG: glycosyltransferase [Cytophagales bacterium]|nr:glycosyltransferase [Cytophagales bacterium]
MIIIKGKDNKSMQQIKALKAQLKAEKFEDKYPLYDLNDGKVHVLYIWPCLNGTGYYRSIAPALELNKTHTHCALISGIHSWDFNKQFDDYDSPVDERLIQWAHYIVLPTIFTDVEYIIRALLEINDDLKFVMDLDQNFHQIPKDHPDHDKISTEMKKQLLKNISRMDLMTGALEELLDYYDSLLEKHFPNSTVFLEYLPNLISTLTYEEIEPPRKGNQGRKRINNSASWRPTSETVRIGLIGSLASAEDILNILESLRAIQNKYCEKVEFIFFGWDGQLKGENKLVDLKFKYVKSVSFTDYINILKDLSLDIALLPLRDISFNTKGKSAIKYFELSVFRIPVIASSVAPYSKVIKHEETGLLVKEPEQWTTAMDSLIQNERFRKRIGKAASRAVWRMNAYNDANIGLYQSVFI